MNAPFRKKPNTAEAEIARLLRQFGEKRARRDEVQAKLDELKRSVAAGMPKAPDLAPLYRALGKAITDGHEPEEERLGAEIARLSEEHDENLRRWHVMEPASAGLIEQYATAVNALSEALLPIAEKIVALEGDAMVEALNAAVAEYVQLARRTQAALNEVRHLAFECAQVGRDGLVAFDSNAARLPKPVTAPPFPDLPAPDGPHAKAAARVKALRDAGVLDALRIPRTAGESVGHGVTAPNAQLVTKG